MVLWQPQRMSFFSEDPSPLESFSPVEADVSVTANAPLIDTARSLVRDCLNQAGVEQLPVWREKRGSQ